MINPKVCLLFISIVALWQVVSTLDTRHSHRSRGINRHHSHHRPIRPQHAEDYYYPRESHHVHTQQKTGTGYSVSNRGLGRESFASSSSSHGNTLGYGSGYGGSRVRPTSGGHGKDRHNSEPSFQAKPHITQKRIHHGRGIKKRSHGSRYRW